MGLLDNILGAAKSEASPADGAVHGGLLDHVLGMVSNPQTGGLGGLIGQLKAGGLESAVQSWIGTGPNQPVSGDQITAALGSPQIQQLAAKFGIPADQVASHLSQILPSLINHLTPGGTVPSQSLVSEGLALAKSHFLSRL